MKQRVQADYYDYVVRQAGRLYEKDDVSPMQFNWPYDYFSIIEFVDIDTNVLYSNDPQTPGKSTVIKYGGSVTSEDIIPPMPSVPPIAQASKLSAVPPTLPSSTDGVTARARAGASIPTPVAVQVQTIPAAAVADSSVLGTARSMRVQQSQAAPTVQEARVSAAAMSAQRQVYSTATLPQVQAASVQVQAQAAQASEFRAVNYGTTGMPTVQAARSVPQASSSPVRTMPAATTNPTRGGGY